VRFTAGLRRAARRSRIHPRGVADARRPAKAEVMLVQLQPGMLWPNPKWQRDPAVNRGCVGSTPTGHPASDARRVECRSRKAEQVGSSPTAGSCDAGAGRRGRRLQTDPKQVRLLPASSDGFRCSSDGQSVCLKSRRPLVRLQPPELGVAQFALAARVHDVVW
jgi:hypothetical protein